jgi:hypothetical protein
MKRRILASSSAIVQLLMSLVPTALAAKVDVKKNFPQQQLLLQQQLVIHQVIVWFIIFCFLYTTIWSKNFMIITFVAGHIQD